MRCAIDIGKVESGDANSLAYIQTESWKSAFNKILSKEDLQKYTNIDKAIEMYDMLLNKNIGNGFILTIEENKRARKFYENQGFILTEKSKKFSDAVEVMYYRKL